MGGISPGLMTPGAEIELQLPVGRRLGRMSASGRSASRGGSGTSSPARSPSPSSSSSGGLGAKGTPTMLAPVPLMKRNGSVGEVNGVGSPTVGASGVGSPVVTPATLVPVPAQLEEGGKPDGGAGATAAEEKAKPKAAGA